MPHKKYSLYRENDKEELSVIKNKDNVTDIY
ncbi:DUF3269 family protein, partial [Staphylococcus aureus]